MRPAAGCLLPLLATLLLPGVSPAADVFYRAIDYGPASPEILGMASDATHAWVFERCGLYEWSGSEWRIVPAGLNGVKYTDLTSPFVAAGRLYAKRGQVVYRLDGDGWRFVRTLPVYANGQISPAVAGDRLYQVDPRCGGGSPVLVSMSLADGSVRTEPAPPVRGRIAAVGSTLYLAEASVCNQWPRDAPAGASSSYPVYRLDGASWAPLPPLDFGPSSIQGTGTALWAFAGSAFAARLLPGGWSPHIPLGNGTYGVSPIVEWNGAFLTTDASRGLLRLEGDAFVPFASQPPCTRGLQPLNAAGRLIVAASDLSLRAFESGAWRDERGMPGLPWAHDWAQAPGVRYARRGSGMWRHDANGWAALPVPPSPPIANGPFSRGGLVWKGRPVISAMGTNGTLELFWFGDDEVWHDLGVPGEPGYWSSAMIVFEGDLYLVADERVPVRYREGAWTALAQPEVFSSRHVVAAGGVLYLFAPGGVLRLEDDRFVPAFSEVSKIFWISGIAEAGGTLYASGRPIGWDPRLPNPPAIVALEPGGYRTLLLEDDLQNLPHLSRSWLGSAGGDLTIGPYALRNGVLTEVRGEGPLSNFSGDGSTAIAFYAYDRTALYGPVPRVRRNLPVLASPVSASDPGFRSTLLLGNFSAVPARALLFLGDSREPSLEIPLRAGETKWIDDPAPGFTGPAGLEFVGPATVEETWAAVHVFVRFGAGTSGALLESRPAGSWLGKTTLYPTPPRDGASLKLALSAAADGNHLPVSLYLPFQATVPSGGFYQTPSWPSPGWPWQEFSSKNPNASSTLLQDDLNIYFVENDLASRDGIVVQPEPVRAALGRRSRFLPAIVSLGARYRTSLAIYFPTTGSEETRWLTSTYRSSKGSGSFDIPAWLSRTALSVPDVGSWLAAHGVPVNPDQVDGTLLLTGDGPIGAATVSVSSAVLATSPAGLGTFATQAPVFEEGEWAREEAVVPGLREGRGFRANVAVANPEPPGGPPVTLSVTLRRASDGAALDQLPAVTLAPGERHQWSRALLRAMPGGGDGWAEVRRGGGSGRFVAYGSTIDEVTGDGLVFRMTRSR